MHQVLLYEGRYEWAVTLLPEICRIEGPDVIHYRGARMGIDEVRSLIQAAYQTPLVEAERHFVIAFSQFTIEAQNALLKIVEEPPLTARLYFVTEKRGTLIPTLMSRLVVMSENEKESEKFHVSAWDVFKAATILERLALIADKTTKKDDVWTESIMNGFETYAHETREHLLMRRVAELRPVFSLPGASKKMILEHLALTLP